MKTQFAPTERQYEAWEKLNDNSTNEILYGGGARWGKSYFGCAWIIIQCISKPGSAWIIGRNELKRLRQTTLLTFFEVAKSLGISEQFNYNAQESVITFVNGSRVFLIDLSYMPSDPNYDRLGSYGITGVFIDEAQEIDAKAVNILKGRFSLLEWEWWDTIPKALYTCNPAKNWIYSEFYKKKKEGRLESNKAFIPSLVTDNPHIKQEYINQLKTADKVTVERLLRGNFEYDDTPGRLFEYDAIIDMQTNNAEVWERYISVDAARKGKDLAIIYVWDGLKLLEYIKIQKCTNTELEQRIQSKAGQYSIGMRNVVVDEDGVGGGIVDHLRCKGFVNNSTPIPGKNWEKPNYQNLKTQCYFKLAEYVNASKINMWCMQGNDWEQLCEELDVIVEKDIDKDGKKKIISKDDVKDKLGRSPDFADALMFRMYFELKQKKKMIFSVI